MAQSIPPDIRLSDSSHTRSDTTTQQVPDTTAGLPHRNRPVPEAGRMPERPQRPMVISRSWPNPSTVLLKSAVLPGWGQFTNRKHFKAAVVFGLEVWFLKEAITNWRSANDARNKLIADPNNAQHFADYKSYWGNRSDNLWYLGITMFVSMFDAYVDAHLIPYREDTIPGVEPPRGIEVVVLTF